MVGYGMEAGSAGRGGRCSWRLPLRGVCLLGLWMGVAPLEAAHPRRETSSSASAPIHSHSSVPTPPHPTHTPKQLSEAVQGHASLGVFPSEAEAAHALDRALLARDGLAAAPALAFPLVDYLPLLGKGREHVDGVGCGAGVETVCMHVTAASVVPCPAISFRVGALNTCIPPCLDHHTPLPCRSSTCGAGTTGGPAASLVSTAVHAPGCASAPGAPAASRPGPHRLPPRPRSSSSRLRRLWRRGGRWGCHGAAAAGASATQGIDDAPPGHRR